MKRKHIAILFLFFLLFYTSFAESPNNNSYNGPLDNLIFPHNATSHRIIGVKEIKPGETLELGKIQGPGIIRHIWFTAQSRIPQVYGLLVLRMYWDGESNPSAQSPLGDFFGVGFGKEMEFKSFPLEMFPA